MIRVTISTGKGYLLMRSLEQSFTFLVVDSLPPAIFVSHVSLSPLYRDVRSSSRGESSNFRGSRMCRGGWLSWPASRKELSRGLVDPTSVMIQRDDEHAR